MREESERAVDAGELAHCLMITSQIVHSTVDDVDVPLSSMFSLFCPYPTALLFRTAQLVTPVFGLSPELTPRALVFVHVRCLLPPPIFLRGVVRRSLSPPLHTAQHSCCCRQRRDIELTSSSRGISIALHHLRRLLLILLSQSFYCSSWHHMCFAY